MAAAIIASITAGGVGRAEGPPPGYKLVWSDEFNYRGLPDPAKWGYEEGFVRNHESQYYTKARAANARVENGTLVIEGRKEQFKSRIPTAAVKRPSTPRPVSSRCKRQAGSTGGSKCGRNCRRAKASGRPSGCWANETPVGWPACGEIDIMEFVGHTPDLVHATVHWGKDYQHHRSQGKSLKVNTPGRTSTSTPWNGRLSRWSFTTTRPVTTVSTSRRPIRRTETRSASRSTCCSTWPWEAMGREDRRLDAPAEIPHRLRPGISERSGGEMISTQTDWATALHTLPSLILPRHERTARVIVGWLLATSRLRADSLQNSRVTFIRGNTMMPPADFIHRTADYVRTTLFGEGTGHDWWHVYRVWKMAQRIGQAEDADLLVVELAALLHDIADWKSHGGDCTVGPKVASDWLTSLNLDPGVIRARLPDHRRHFLQGSGVSSRRCRWKGRLSRMPTAWMRWGRLALPVRLPTGVPRAG